VSSALLWLLSAAVLLLAGAVLLWTWARQRSRGSAVARFLDARVDARRAPAAGDEAAPATAAPRRADHGGEGLLQRLRERAGLREGPRSALLLVAPTLLPIALVGAVTGAPPVAALAGAFGLAATALTLSLRIQRRQQALTRALPGFIDSLVRLLAVGHSVASAFLASVPAVQGPLRACLDTVSLRVRAGADLDKALEQASRVQGSPALMLFAAVVRMSVKYGGRVDQLLERMAQFMRDREEAQQELIALSAETRMSAWILGLLPLSMGLFILFVQAQYLARMWADAGGRKLLMLAFGLQLLGGFLLYRLARLR
jgi:tight adherence protein B